MIDVAAARRDTPGCEEVIHFNNAGSSLPPRQVTEAVVEHLRLEERIGGYEAFEAAAERINDVYAAVAELIGAKPSEIAFLDSATRAWNMAFFSLDFKPGDRILTGQSEYASNYIAYLQTARRQGVEVVAIGTDEYGQLSIPDLERNIDERTKLIAITHVPTNGGLVNPAEKIGEVARAAKIPFLLDACQSVGQLELDVRRIGCDMLSVTGRKFLRGPRGTGFLFVREELIEQMEPLFIDLYGALWATRDTYQLRPDAKRFENYETSFACKIGLGVAVRYALGLGMRAIEERVYFLADTLRRRLSAIPGVRLTDLGERPCGIVTFMHPSVAPQELKALMREKRINIWTSGARSTRLDMEARGLTEVVRLSVHYYNTEDEIERLCREIEKVVARKAA